MREPARRAPLLVTPEDILSEAVEMDICFHGGPAFGEHRGYALCQGPLRDGVNFFI